MIRLIALCLIFIAGNIFAGGRSQPQPRPEPPHFQNENENEETDVPPGQSQQNRGEQVMRALAAAHIMKASAADPQVRSWLNNINTLDGWSWRNIADTQSRSFHAYGAAVDILPKSLGGKETYWLWSARNRPEWWNISYNERFHPPDAVIRAFERYGFIWGGKWLMFDTMHFEYRPEILILSGIPPESIR